MPYLALPNYVEVIDDYAPTDGSLETDSSGHSLKLRVLWDDFPTACQSILGYAIKQSPGVPGSPLTRVLPRAHPWIPFLYATKITSFKGMIFDGDNSPATSDEAPINGGQAIGEYAIYDYVEFTVLFQTLTYQVYSDTYISNNGGNEFLRYVTPNQAPRAEALQMDRGTFVYNAPGKAWDQKPVSAGVSKVQAKINFSWLWHVIPEDGAFTNGSAATGIMAKQLALVGTINNAAYNGYPAYTLLLNAPKVTPHNFGVEPDFANTQSSRFFDIEFPVTYFAPALLGGGNGDWRYVPDPSGSYSPIWSETGHNNLYVSADWTPLFTLN